MTVIRYPPSIREERITLRSKKGRVKCRTLIHATAENAIRKGSTKTAEPYDPSENSRKGQKQREREGKKVR